MRLYSYAAASIKIVCGLQRRSRQRLYDCAPAFVTMDSGIDRCQPTSTSLRSGIKLHVSVHEVKTKLLNE